MVVLGLQHLNLTAILGNPPLKPSYEPTSSSKALEASMEAKTQVLTSTLAIQGHQRE